MHKYILDESNDEDAQGVHNTFAIIENLIELEPTIASTICRKTELLKFLLRRVMEKKFDPIKLYASEILSILLQSTHSEGSDVGKGQGQKKSVLQLFCDASIDSAKNSDGMVSDSSWNGMDVWESDAVP
jgi:hypothetical protein